MISHKQTVNDPIYEILLSSNCPILTEFLDNLIALEPADTDL